MKKIVFISGGARSGKSNFAQHLCVQSGLAVAYIATASVTDADMKERIRLHKESRPPWKTYEQYKDLAQVIEGDDHHEMYLLDCITVLINNYLFDSGFNFDTASAQEVQGIEEKISHDLQALVQACRKKGVALVMVANEVGMSVVPENRLARFFCDINGRINQHMASLADQAFVVISGMALPLKDHR